MNKTLSTPVIHVAPSTATIMWHVNAALLPGIALLVWTQGSRWIGLLATAVISAWFFEALILKLRGKLHILRTLGDGSATLTALLLMLSIPVMTPPWLIIFGVGFAIVFAKQLYGGLGMNTFNPAMVGYAFLLVSFPALMGQHSAQSLSLFSLLQPVDATTSATILDQTRQLRIASTSVSEAQLISPNALWIQLAWIAGGVYLALKRYLSWQIVCATLLGIIVCASLFFWIDGEKYLTPWQQLISGASIFGAIFIATDPVSAATTPLGRWIYGFLVGILTIAIRNLGNFPDGLAFAVLLSNALVPIIDMLTQPRYR